MLKVAGFDVLDAALLVVLAGLLVELEPETDLETNDELDELDFDADAEDDADVAVLTGFTAEDAETETEIVTEALEDTNRLLEVLAEPVPAFWYTWRRFPAPQ